MTWFPCKSHLRVTEATRQCSLFVSETGTEAGLTSGLGGRDKRQVPVPRGHGLRPLAAGRVLFAQEHLHLLPLLRGLTWVTAVPQPGSDLGSAESGGVSIRSS